MEPPGCLPHAVPYLPPEPCGSFRTHARSVFGKNWVKNGKWAKSSYQRSILGISRYSSAGFSVMGSSRHQPAGPYGPSGTRQRGVTTPRQNFKTIYTNTKLSYKFTVSTSSAMHMYLLYMFYHIYVIIYMFLVSLEGNNRPVNMLNNCKYLTLHIKYQTESGCDKIIKLKIKAGLNILTLNRYTRKILNINNDEAIYLFKGKNMLAQSDLSFEGNLNITIIFERTFGNSDPDEEALGFDGNDNTLEKHVITCSYSNTRGSSAEKLLAIELETNADRDFMATELNLRENDVNKLTENLGVWARIVAGDDYTYSKGKRMPPSNGAKKLGYGTGIVSKEENCMTKYMDLDKEGELKFEILALDVVMSEKCREGRIIVYRSPSMKCEEEISQFYSRVGRYIQHMFDSKRFDCISYIGDSNKESSPRAMRLEKALMIKHGLRNLIGSLKTRVDPSTKRETQPDSCYCWFNPSVVTVSATVNGKIHTKMDHRLIRMRYILKGVAPKIREFYEFERVIRDKGISDESIRKKLSEEIDLWNKKYAQYVFRIRSDGSWIEYPKDTNIQVRADIVDLAIDDFFDLCTRVRHWMSKTVKLKYPTTVPENANDQEVKIGQLSALLGDFSAKILKNPTNIGLRDKFEKIEKEKAELIIKVSQEHLESKMKYMCDGVQRCSKDFFKITGK